MQQFKVDGVSLYTTSNGSDPEFRGSFGWTLCTSNGSKNISQNNDVSPSF